MLVSHPSAAPALRACAVSRGILWTLPEPLPAAPSGPGCQHSPGGCEDMSAALEQQRRQRQAGKD